MKPYTPKLEGPIHFGVFDPPLASQNTYFSEKAQNMNKAIFGLNNHETIHSQVRGAHLLCFGVFDPPLAP